MQLAIADIVGIVLMLCAAGSRLLPLTEPFWNRLPDKLQPVVPALLLWLPQLGDLAGVATTQLDLVEMVLLTLAALFPGAHTRTRLGAKTPEVRASHRPPPDDDPPAGENPVGTVLPPNPNWSGTGPNRVAMVGSQPTVLPQRRFWSSGRIACMAVLLIGCSAGATPPPTSSLPPDDPCRPEKIYAFAIECSGACQSNAPEDPNPCLDRCEGEIDRRCGQ